MGWLTFSMQAGFFLGPAVAGLALAVLDVRTDIAVTTIALGHTSGFWGPAILIIIGTPFIATAYVAMGVVFGGLSEASTRGVTMGAYGTVLFLGLAAGPLIFGPIVQTYGYAAGFTACAVAAIGLALVMAAMHVERLRRREEVPLPPAAPAPG